jgi:hypothetical protein
MKPITEIYARAIGNCSLLKDIDLSQLEIINSEGLGNCYLDTVYAPQVTSLPSTFGKYCYVRVIDLPNAVGEIGSSMFECSTTQELYLDSATSVTSSSAFKNVIKLRILYLPNVTQFYGTSTSISTVDSLLTGDYWKTKAPLDIIWIPNAQSAPSTVYLYDTKLLFAPNLTSLSVCTYYEYTSASIVLSEKITDTNLTISGKSENTVLIAPEDSYVQEYASNEENNCTFVSQYDCAYCGTDEDGNLTYTAGDNEFYVPLDFVTPYWTVDSINCDVDDFYWSFLLDFTNDNFVNAKDYGVLIKEISG